MGGMGEEDSPGEEGCGEWETSGNAEGFRVEMEEQYG